MHSRLTAHAACSSETDSSFFGRTNKWLDGKLRHAFAALILLAGIAMAVLLPVGPASAATFDEQLDMLLSQPIFVAIIDGDANKEREIRERLKYAYQTGGDDAFLREVQKLGEEFGQNAMVQKIPAARNQDIIEFFSTSVAIARRLEFEDKRICYQWAFGAQYNDRVAPQALDRAIGPQLGERLVYSIVGLIKNAGDQPVPYDRFNAQLSIQQTASSVLGRLDQGPLQVIAGMRPAYNEEEMRVVCRAMGDMYAFILGLDNASDTFREMFRPQPNTVSHLGAGGMTAIRQVFKDGDPENIFAGKDLGFSNALRP